MTENNKRTLQHGTTSKTVLLVDDEPDILELLEITLLKMGLFIDKANGVKEALAKLATQHYDLCLTDMRMPDGDGLDIIKFITSKRLDIPVAVITAHGNMENAITVLKAGAFDYLAKPLSLAQLRTLVGLRRGLLNKQIAHELNVTEATVKAHMTALFRKLGVLNRTQALIAAAALDLA